jgi:hypothetical protein
VTILPQASMADAAIGELRRFGVDTSHIVRSAGRMGIYFLETGASPAGFAGRLRPRGSAFALAAPAGVDWRACWPARLVSRHRHHAAVSRAACLALGARAPPRRASGVVRSQFPEEPLEWGKAASA